MLNLLKLLIGLPIEHAYSYYVISLANKFLRDFLLLVTLRVMLYHSSDHCSLSWLVSFC